MGTLARISYRQKLRKGLSLEGYDAESPGTLLCYQATFFSCSCQVRKKGSHSTPWGYHSDGSRSSRTRSASSSPPGVLDLL